MRQFIMTIAICTVLGWAGSVGAGTLDRANAAYKSGDYAEAATGFRALAVKGLAHAQSNLGFMYRKGQGVPQDYIEAVKWYRKAAEQGYAKSQASLGAVYGNGTGIPQDYVQAHMWLNLAAEQGDEIAKENRDDIMAKRMTPAMVQEAQRLAGEWRPKK